LKIGVLYPTTWQLIEKMAALFPQGVEVVGQVSDDRHYWNDPTRKLEEWNELGLNISLNIRSYSDIDFSQYDVLIESAETFSYSKDWIEHCTRIECPVLLKVCWSKDPALIPLPSKYIKKVKDFPVLLEMPAHSETWKAAGFNDVNVIFNPVGEWWFSKEWTGEDQRVLFVLSGANAWRGSDPSWFGLDIWDKICQAFPNKSYHHDGHLSYKTSMQMAEMFRKSRVFVNLDKPYGQGERPITLAFTEALSAGLPVVARNLPGLSYGNLIDGNGICTNDLQEMISFIRKCLDDLEFARACSERSRKIAERTFSNNALKPKYQNLIERSTDIFNKRHSFGGFRRHFR
jgi:glycosyltransferase involved in cell wall biosynthesis